MNSELSLFINALIGVVMIFGYLFTAVVCGALYSFIIIPAIKTMFPKQTHKKIVSWRR